jgi:hopanoid biosynthesis associated protein HpnK
MESFAKRKSLIVSADDFGLTEKVNDGIAAAHRDGIITSASLLANGRAFASAAEILRSNPNLDAGLHLNLTEGEPVTEGSMIPSLAGRSGFLYHSPAKLALAVLRHRVRISDIEREIRSQLEKILKAGVRLTHVDGHKHLHVAPSIFAAIARIAPEYGIKAVRTTVERCPLLRFLLKRHRSASAQILKQYVSGRMLSAAFRVSEKVNRVQGLMSPICIYGITQTGFMDDLDVVTAIARDVSPGVSEMMFHPGYVDEQLEMLPTRLRLQRERETAMLTSAALRQLLREHNIELISYRDFVREYGHFDHDPVFDHCSAL